MNITKALAAQIAKKMTKPLYDIAVNKHSKWHQDVKAFWIEALPKPVKDLYKSEHGQYIRHTEIRFYGMGLQRYQANRIELPWSKDMSSEYVLKPENEWIATQWLEFERYKETVEETKQQIEHQLLAMRTFKRVHQEWPEAAVFLPAETSTSLTVNVKPLNDKLAALLAVNTPSQS
jgi:hypothetical protein